MVLFAVLRMQRDADGREEWLTVPFICGCVYTHTHTGFSRWWRGAPGRVQGFCTCPVKKYSLVIWPVREWQYANDWPPSAAAAARRSHIPTQNPPPCSVAPSPSLSFFSPPPLLTHGFLFFRNHVTRPPLLPSAHKHTFSTPVCAVSLFHEAQRPHFHLEHIADHMKRQIKVEHLFLNIKLIFYLGVMKNAKPSLPNSVHFPTLAQTHTTKKCNSPPLSLSHQYFGQRHLKRSFCVLACKLAFFANFVHFTQDQKKERNDSRRI